MPADTFNAVTIGFVSVAALCGLIAIVMAVIRHMLFDREQVSSPVTRRVTNIAVTLAFIGCFGAISGGIVQIVNTNPIAVEIQNNQGSSVIPLGMANESGGYTEYGTAGEAMKKAAEEHRREQSNQPPSPEEAVSGIGGAVANLPGLAGPFGMPVMVSKLFSGATVAMNGAIPGLGDAVAAFDTDGVYAAYSDYLENANQGEGRSGFLSAVLPTLSDAIYQSRLNAGFNTKALE